MKKSQVFGLILSILVLIVMNFIPTTELFTVPGRNTLGILVALLILIITEPIPLGVSCMLSTALLVIFGAAPNLGVALSGYTNPIVFFVLVSFGISAAITKVPISKRLLQTLITVFGKNVKLVLFALMVCAAIISSVLSNVATTVIFIALILDFLKIYKNPEDKKRTGKAFMIGLPVASMLGGMMTPAGSSLNLLVLNLLEQQTQLRVTFVEWMVFGIPIVLVTLPIAWLLIVKIYKPVEIPQIEIKKYVDNLDVPKKIDFSEAYVMVVFAAMFILWVLSSWYPVFNVTLVTIVGFGFLFVPKIAILTWDEFIKSISWPAFFLVASVISVGNLLVTNGVSKWISTAVFPTSINLPSFGLVFVVALIVFLMLIIVPVAPALIPMLAPPLIILANNAGVSPIITMMTLGLTVCNCFFLPIDTVPLLTYLTGYYEMWEMPKSTLILQVIIAVVVAIWVPITIGILGLA
ncbi:sodium-dependent dicarboxylate transporter SdcS [Oxobacter pfennigii]|uniref:Sodium-dependent dicarboxylate transporter SdcS n=1 Tax=Oxobacter pfennigii TaxID=36849 RepID=A0A0P9ABD8_9CLOT|nr:SLC13 family permease [Oxobacter pfennigii]KPU42373.1 sodium-dependent dicarboxylate transporter SdcS [Oxobacter pfennigii]